MRDKFGFNGGEFSANSFEFLRLDQGRFSIFTSEKCRIYLYKNRLEFVDLNFGRWGIGEENFGAFLDYGNSIKQVIKNGKIDYVSV